MNTGNVLLKHRAGYIINIREYSIDDINAYPDDIASEWPGLAG